MKIYFDACSLNRLTDDQTQLRIRQEAEASETVEVDDPIANRAANLQVTGYGTYDALHLACAEAAKVDVALTTGDGFIRRASRRDGKPLVAVRNPLFFSKENLP